MSAELGSDPKWSLETHVEEHLTLGVNTDTQSRRMLLMWSSRMHVNAGLAGNNRACVKHILIWGETLWFRWEVAPGWKVHGAGRQRCEVSGRLPAPVRHELNQTSRRLCTGEVAGYGLFHADWVWHVSSGVQLLWGKLGKVEGGEDGASFYQWNEVKI